MQVRAKTACEAAGLDRDRFNEDVKAQFYPCAPSTDPGRPRIFEDHDLVALWFYGFLRNRRSMSPAEAGSIACRVGDQARQMVNAGKEIAGDIVIGWDEAGSSYCAPRVSIATGEEAVATVLDGTCNAYGGTLSPMALSMTFPLGNVLAIMHKRVKELTAPVGEN